jgi:hypothetical protein
MIIIMALLALLYVGAIMLAVAFVVGGEHWGIAVMAAVLMGGVVGCGDKDKDKKASGTSSSTKSTGT